VQLGFEIIEVRDRCGFQFAFLRTGLVLAHR
jgi:hypothetical protein